MEKIDKNLLLEYICYSDYEKGREYEKNKIRLISDLNNLENKPIKEFNFFVISEHNCNRHYLVSIRTYKNKIRSFHCDCPQFRETNSCKHISTCLINYYEEIFHLEGKINSINYSDNILNYLETNNKVERKEEVFIIPMISINFYDGSYGLGFKIGQDKYYSLLGKFNNFYSAYLYNLNYKFGKNFTYDSSKHYFSEKSKRLIDFISSINSYDYYGNYFNNNRIIKDIIDIYKDKIYLENINKFIDIVNKFPFNISLKIKENKYKIKIIELDKYLIPLTDDYELIFYNNTIYRLNEKQKQFIYKWSEYSFKELEYDIDKFPNIEQNILSIIKDNIILDNSTKDIIINTKPVVKLYFDIDKDIILCSPKFYYQDIEIGLDNNINNNIVRDLAFEKEVYKELEDMGFIFNNNKYILDDFDKSCEFINTNINLIKDKYNIYTSTKLNNTKIIKNTNITSTFSIGKDNILRYDFDLGNISTDELDDIFSSLKEKKKYYRLKDGNIISLKDDSLSELKTLTEDLELDKNKNSGIIPKYRAIYLDSLKDKKYNIIRTDSLFNDFIKTFKSYKNININFSKEENDILRDYQKDGVRWLYTIYKCGLGGILADEMGLGKSIQTIMFLKKILEEDNSSKFLIVCPTALIYNWLNEFNKFGKELDVEIFSGNKNTRIDKLNKYKGNIYITSYGLLREDINIYKDIRFKVFVIDEGQNIKNPDTGITKAVKEINSLIKIALTGTPIENSIMELWSIFDFIMPGFLNNYTNFHKKYNIHEFDKITDKLLSNLKKIIKPFILRRKKSDVVKDLPSKIINNVYIDMNDKQKKVYASEVNYVKKEMDNYINNGGFIKNKMIILTLLTRLRQICIDPKIIYDDYNGDSAKIDNLINIIKELVENGHKILLFTSFKTALNIVKDNLEKENISNYVISGDVNSKKRQELVDSFNKDDTNVFLIMLKSGGTGLNLTSADVVIHLDLWWNPQVENQATDRTHRIGQTKTVEVVKLICKGTIEEKILQLQEKKKQLSDRLLEKDMDNSNYLNTLTEKDIRYMLEFENKN